MAPRPEGPVPQWQPIDKLPVIAYAIDGMLESAEEQYPALEEARPQPHMLDDYTASRVVEVYTEQRDDLWMYVALASGDAHAGAAAGGRAIDRPTRAAAHGD